LEEAEGLDGLEDWGESEEPDESEEFDDPEEPDESEEAEEVEESEESEDGEPAQLTAESWIKAAITQISAGKNNDFFINISSAKGE